MVFRHIGELYIPYRLSRHLSDDLQNGAPVDGNMGKAMEEFGPEMEKVREAYRFRVDRISGEDNDRNKVERVRVNNEGNKEKGDYRDIYGSHIAAGK